MESFRTKMTGGTDPSQPPILITGGAGYIGSHVVLACQDAGYPVVVVDNFSTGSRESIPDGTSLIEADIADFDAIKDLIETYRITSVIHLAASTSVPESVERPLDYYSNNTANGLLLLQACIRANVRNLIFSSTAVVYGVPSQNPIPEEASTNPISPYGRSKLMTEWMIREAASAHNLNYVVLRFFNVAGADPSGRAGPRGHSDNHLIKVASEAAVGKRDSVTVFGSSYSTKDGSCIRDYVHVSDIADAHVAALKKMEADGGDFESVVLNCGYGLGVSVLEVLEAVAAEAPTPFRIVKGSPRAGDAPVLVADATRIQECLRWSPRYGDLGSIIRSAIAWEKMH